MEPGNCVHDASRSEHDSADRAGAIAGFGHDRVTQSSGTRKPLQDIQDIIDKLAVVTQELRRPGSRVPGSSR